MKIWEFTYKALPKTPYEGPPLPNGLEILWPQKVRTKFPQWVGGFSVNVMSRGEDKIIRALGAKQFN